MKPTEYNFPTVIRHVYDVDAFEIIDRLKEKHNSNSEQAPEHLRDLEFINLQEESLIKFLNEEGFDSSEHQKHRNFIIPSYYNLYNTYLGYKLLTFDLYKIEPLLSYQSVLFLGNYYASKDNFLGLIEFLVYDFVKAGVLPFEQIRLEKIVNWLERVRSATKEAKQILKGKSSKEPNIDEDFLSAEQAASFLKLKLNTIYSKAEKGDLPFYRSGKRKLLFSKKELEQYVVKRKVKSLDEINEEVETYKSKK